MRELSNENVIHVVKEGVQYLQFKRLLQYDDIITHAYSLGLDTNYRTARVNKQALPKEEFDKAVEDYKKLCSAINENYINIVKTNQEHTNNVKVVEQKVNKDFMDININEYDKTDGLVTNKSNLVLSTTNADCILLMFFDPVNKVIANVHSGWRGTLQKISVNAVSKMIDEFNCDSKNIICCICPSIRKCHFEVDKEVKDMFENEFQDLNISTSKEIMEKQDNDEKWNIDTVLINKIMLEQEGVKPENIIDSGLCSVCNSNIIHSFRVEKEGYGLATALISLK